MVKAKKPLLAFAAYSGTGKTTVLTGLLPLLKQRGLRVGVIKHAHHSFEIDHPGKDSFELRKAGAGQMLVASSRRWALIVEDSVPGDPSLPDLLGHLNQETLDLILVEGFKHEAVAKIELFRPSLGHAPIYPDDPYVIAVATDGEVPQPTRLPVLDLNDCAGIADFVAGWMGREADGGA